MRRQSQKRDVTERELIGWLRRRIHIDKSTAPIGPGDDMALVAAGAKRILVAIDTIAEGVDFTLEGASAGKIGRKALAVNLSDVAAMGGAPAWCMASVALRKGLGADFAKGVAKGLLRLSRKYRCPLVGGDVTGWKDGVVVTVAIGATPAGPKPITRAGARAGDAVCVTGTLGGSILGKHLRFEPRVAEGAWLAKHARVTAMIDISDGLGVDAAHIAAESRAGIVIDEERIPVSAAAKKLAKSDGKTALCHAIGDGEDFELLFALGERDAQRAIREWPFKTRVTVIGRVVKGRGVVLSRAGGRKERIDTEGYEHLG